ncbi:MAG: DUF998 domain-containing protein [Chloroflexota bacterium]
MKLKPFALAVAYFVVFIVIAHFFVPPTYAWTQNTISDLASQGHIFKWIMQAGFIGFGLILTWGVLHYFNQHRNAYFLLLVALYGLSILMSGIFCTNSLDPSYPNSLSESWLHSIFATTAGVGLSLAIGWQGFASPGKLERRNHLLFLLLVMGFSSMFGLAENGSILLEKGIVQRLLYLIGLAWLIYQEQLFVKDFSSKRD